LKDKTGRSLRKRVGEELHGLVGEGEPGAVEIAVSDIADAVHDQGGDETEPNSELGGAEKRG